MSGSSRVHPKKGGAELRTVNMYRLESPFEANPRPLLLWGNLQWPVVECLCLSEVTVFALGSFP